MEWEHYARLEPFQEFRADYRAASIVSMLYNVNRTKDSKQYTIEDFVLKFGEREEQPKTSRENHITAIKAIALAYSVKAKDV